jgi:hypothetical protein
MLRKIITAIKKNKYAVYCVQKFISRLQRFAWLLNPILSVRRFGNVLANGKKTADFCFVCETSTEFLEQVKRYTISSYKCGSFELVLNNHLYGHAKALKNYVGLPDIYPIKVLYSHGLTWNNYILTHYNWSYDMRIPTFLAWGHNEKKMISECFPNTKIYVTGAPFLYSDNFFSKEYINKERKRLGKNLLVFPAHSAKVLVADFSDEDFVKLIRVYEDQFDTIRICCYWKDIQLDRYQVYTKNGFEIVTAGHSSDCNYISRLKGLLSICDATITNGFGSHIGYSIAMNKPVKLLPLTGYKDTVSVCSIPEIGLLSEPAKLSCIPEIKLLIDKLQKNENFDITQEITDLIEPYWGLHEKKSKEELRQIFFEAEQLFKKSPYRHQFLEFR